MKIEEQNATLHKSQEELIKYLFNKNISYLESKIQKEPKNTMYHYFLAKIYFNTASFLLQQRDAIDDEIRTMLTKAIDTCKNRLLKDKRYLKEVKEFINKTEKGLM